ncbi:MAG: AcrB/AcrD/AcrF family protein [Haliscomenobacteraceae bacterium CHB4]|nr:Multidrug resistance protein MdtB [Saprospiraceae bacterium]MCE7924825.1 AcrB/AcrD/AcrF family protein [Haliscomenobacteraceae bacterium CHB4]
MSLTELSIKKPVVVLVGFLVLCLFGLYGYTQLRYELLPKFSTSFTNITTIYPGASPDEIESSLTKPIEEAVALSDGIKHITGTSSEGVSTVFIEYESGVDADEAFEDAQRQVNKILSDLPESAKTPVLSKLNANELPILRISATANITGTEFGELLDETIKTRLTQIKGVGEVEFIGLEEREIQVELDAQRMELRQVSPLQVVGALSQANLNVPAGNMDNPSGSTAVTIKGKASAIESLNEVVVATSPSGDQVELSEVATLRDDKKPPEKANRLNGKSAVGISVKKQTEANALEVSQKMRLTLDELEKEFAAEGLQFDVAQDSSEFTVAANKAVQVDLVLAILLVALVMLVFLHSLRNAFIVLVAIPASLISTFVFMYAFGFSLNMMTLLAMSLVVGILVDDAIVVLENIHRHLEMGKNSYRAAVDGRNEIGFTAMAITMVDVVVFLPLVFVEGIAGDIVREFAGVIVVSTLLSLLVCFTLTPMMAARFSRHEKPGRFGNWFERQFSKMENAYGNLLAGSLRRRRLVQAGVFALFVLVMTLPGNGFIGSEFVPSMDKGEIALTVQMPASATLAETDRAAQDLEKELQATMPEIRKIFTYVGSVGETFGPAQTTNFELNITFSPKEERAKTITELAQEAKFKALKIPGATVKSSPINLFGQADDAPIQLALQGDDRDSVRLAADRVVEILSKISGASDLRLSAQKRKPEIRIEPNHEKLAEHGLTTEDIGKATRIALSGNDDLEVRLGDSETPLRIRLRSDDVQSLDAIEHLTLTNRYGKPVSLSQVAYISEGFAAASLERKERNVSTTVYAQAVGRPSGDIGKEFKEKIAGESLHGCKIQYLGDLANQEESFSSMGLALLAGIVLMYLVMVALYESWSSPFIVLFSIPVALVGALLALALSGETMNIFSIFGIIMMTGLVAKNAILLVDRANDNRSRGIGVHDALIESGKSRLRPILMTTLAMVIGMLPIAIGHGLGGELKRGLGWALIGGLSSSMFLTLVLVPTIYYDFEKLKTWFAKIFKSNRHDDSDDIISDKTLAKSAVATIVVGLIVFFNTGVVAAQDAQKLSMEEAVELVKTKNLLLRASRLEIEKSRLKEKEIRSQRMPAVAMESQLQHNIESPVIFMPNFRIDPATGEFSTGDEYNAIRAYDKNSYSANLTVSTPLINRSIKAAAAATRAEAATYEADLMFETSDKVFETKKLYLQILIAQEQHRLAQASLNRAKETLTDTRGLWKNGAALDLDTLRAFVSVQNLTPNVSKSEKTILVLKETLAAMLDLPSADIELTDKLEFQNYEQAESAARLADMACAQRPEFLQIAAQNSLLDASTRLERTKYLPTLTAFAQGGYNAQSPNLEAWNADWVGSAFTGLKLKVPIFTPTIKPALQQIDVSRKQLSLQKNYLERMVVTEIESAGINLRDARERYGNQQANIAAAERSLQLTKSRWKTGLSKLSDVSDAELALNQSQTNQLQALYDYLIAGIEMEKAIGK